MQVIDSAINASSFPLESVVQKFLSQNLHLLGIGGLKLIDCEYPTKVGRIVILARDSKDRIYVIELKRNDATREDFGQLMSYLGELHREDPHTEKFGILVASGITEGGSAALVTSPYVSYFCYSVLFNFEGIVRNHLPGKGLMSPPPVIAQKTTETTGRSTQETTKRYCIYCRSEARVRLSDGGSAQCTQCGNYL